MGQTDWLGFESREAFQQHLLSKIIQHTADITIEAAREQYAALVFKPSRLYFIKSKLMDNQDGTVTDRLSFHRLPLDPHADSYQEDIPIGDITVTFQDGDTTHVHNERPCPQANHQEVQRAYDTLAGRIAMIEQNIGGKGLMLANTEHFNGMYTPSKIGLPDLPTPYCTPDPRSVEYALRQRVLEGKTQPPQFPHVHRG